MNLHLDNKIKSLQLTFSENMVHIIFLLNTSHPIDHYKIYFTNFGAQKLEI